MSNNAEILISVIMEEAFQEAESVLRKAEKEAACIRESSQQEKANLLKQKTTCRNQAEPFFLKAKMVSQAELQARMEIIHQKEAIFQKNFETLQKEFFSLHLHQDYPFLMKKLILQSLNSLEGSKFILQVNERDYYLLSTSFIEEIVKETGKEIYPDQQYRDIRGGVITVRCDGKVLYDNSLEAIFQRQEEAIRSLVSQHLFFDF